MGREPEGKYHRILRKGGLAIYTCSDAFHTAVQNGNHQIALLIFDDCVFDNNDINVSNGITFHDIFNPEENICIGRTIMNNVSFSLFNDNGTLDNYSFGEFLATIGVRTEENIFNPSAEIHMETSVNRYDCYSARPYLRRNGFVMGTQPAKSIKSIFSFGGKVYAFTEDTCYVYADSTGYLLQTGVNAHMQYKGTNDWAGKGLCYYGNTMNVWEGVYNYVYEFCPLGFFNADRPNVSNTIELSFSCDDRMSLMDVDYPGEDALGISYPFSFQSLLSAICSYIGVNLATTSFINSTAVLTSKPDEFDTASIRDIIGWIAEAAACNARFNREGNLELVWFSSTSQSYDENNYSEYHPYWYEVENIGKLHNRTSSNSTEKTVGSGTNGYLIQDNPLLKGVS